MAVHFDTPSVDWFERNSDLPDEQLFTAMAWIYLPSSSTEIVSTVSIDDGVSKGIGLIVDMSSTNQLVLDTHDDFDIGSNMSEDTWFHLAPASGASTVKGYFNGVEDVSVSTPSAFTPAALTLGAAEPPSYSEEVYCAHYKCWDATLTIDEIKSEMRTIMPQRLNSLHMWTPIFPGSTERLADYSGNGRNWTQNGTVVDVPGPSVAWDIKPATFLFQEPPPGYQQEGYRWRLDDGSQTGATWAENQDTSHTVSKETKRRLRILVNRT